MRNSAFELQLPLDDGAAGALARQRIDHLRSVNGVDEATLIRLARSFPSLAAIYGASEQELASAVGDVTAARIRWFLDAPLETRLLAEPALHQTVVRAA